MKLLNCIISYNRYYYLKNLIESLEEFFPYGDTVIIDDQSDNPSTKEYLNELRSKGIPVFSTTVDKTGLLHGGLYHAMDMGMQYAVENGYDYINYLQDDLQCMWYDGQFEQRVTKLFSFSDKVLSVHSVFLKKIMAYELTERIKLYPQLDAYHLTPYAIPDISIVPVDRFTRLGVKFADSTNENAFNKTLYERGFITLIPKVPHFAWIPWPETTRYGVSAGDEAPPVTKYYYKPISGRQLDKFKKRRLSSLPFVESYAHTWRYFSLKPYWFTNYSRQYMRMLRRNISAGHYTLPHYSIRL